MYIIVTLKKEVSIPLSSLHLLQPSYHLVFLKSARYCFHTAKQSSPSATLLRGGTDRFGSSCVSIPLSSLHLLQLPFTHPNVPASVHCFHTAKQSSPSATFKNLKEVVAVVWCMFPYR